MARGVERAIPERDRTGLDAERGIRILRSRHRPPLVPGQAGGADVPMSFDRITECKARKPHRCVECCGVIPAGEIYWRWVGICEGDLFAEKLCADCKPLYQEANQRAWKYGGTWIPFGALGEDIFESGDPQPHEFPGVWMCVTDNDR